MRLRVGARHITGDWPLPRSVYRHFQNASNASLYIVSDILPFESPPLKWVIALRRFFRMRLLLAIRCAICQRLKRRRNYGWSVDAGHIRR